MPHSVSETQETPYSWFRMLVGMAICSIGGVGMWSVVVALPAVQAEFGSARSGASLPYTLVMLGIAAGGVLMGRMADKKGIVPPMLFGAVSLCVGYVLSGFATSLWQFAVLHGVLIGALGSSVTFGPLIADVSLWFTKRRGIAVALCASGNYIAGAIWPRVVQHGIDTVGWRTTHIGIGIFCLVTLVPLALLLRRRAPALTLAQANESRTAGAGRLNMSPRTLQVLLGVAGVSCCVAMSMPQVHLVAYCGDLGYGAARGAEMLSIMLGLGIISRVSAGFVADKIGGVATVLIGAIMQGLSLTLFLFFDSLSSLYVISAMFGLFQGGIVPTYAIIVREYFPAGEAGTRVGLVFMATLIGMALGGWVSGAIFDLSGSYALAFLNGVLWNLVNVAIIGTLLLRGGGPLAVFRARTIAATARA